MLEQLDSIDKALFLIINMGWRNPVTDFVMPIATNDMLLRILYGATILILLWKGDRRWRFIAVFSGLVLLLTDQAAAGLLKDWIGRLRPCHFFNTEEINLLVGCGGGKAMPSAHAANSFGQAVFFALQSKRIGWYLYPAAAIISMSRVFVGVHYPGDVLAGALIGALAGALVVVLFGKLYPKFLAGKINIVDKKL